MQLVRDDLDVEDLAALERQFPGLSARLTILPMAGGGPSPDNGSLLACAQGAWPSLVCSAATSRHQSAGRLGGLSRLASGFRR